MKTCSMCKIEKSLLKFGKRPDRPIGVRSRCLECEIAIRRSRKFPPQSDGFKQCTKCNHTKRLTEFFAANYVKSGRSSECKQCSNIRKLNVLKHKPEKRITENLRRRTRAVLAGINKSAATLDLIGCSAKQLKEYIESKFLYGMSWENYGEWHIDHIIPCTSFNLNEESEQRRCFHYSNLQPLWAKDNLRKGDTLCEQL